MEKIKMKRVVASLLMLSFCSLNSAAVGQIVVPTGTVKSVESFSNSTDGGAYNTGGGATINLTGDTYSDNSTAGNGGVVYAEADSQINVTKATTFSGNKSNSPYYGGGVIYTANRTSDATVINVADGSSFLNNSGAAGGALAIWGKSETTIGSLAADAVGVSFTGNTATNGGPGGAIYHAGASASFPNGFYDPSATLDNFGGTLTIGNNSSFTGNSAELYGGAIWNENGNLVIGDGVTFDSNTATYYGGAIGSSPSYTVSPSLDYSSKTTDTVDIGENNVFTNNSAASAGAVLVDEKTVATVGTGTEFSKNKATSGDGGAILNYGDTTVTGVEFTGNSAKNTGGAISNSGSNLKINGGTSFDGNTANTGGAIYTDANVALNTSAGDISFGSTTLNSDGSGQNDIFLAENSSSTTTMTLSGGTTNSVLINSGIAGVANAQITNSGTTLSLNEGSVNSHYVGAYTQTSGATELNSEFFGGTKNVIEGGDFSLNDGAEIVAGSAVTIKNAANASVAAGANATISGSLTDEGTFVNNGNLTVTAEKGTATLSVGGLTQADGATLKVSDGGVLDAANGNLTLDTGILEFSGTGAVAKDDIITITDAVQLVIENKGSVTFDGTGLEVGTGHIAVASGSSLVMDKTNVIVSGGVLTQNITVSNASITADPAGALTIGSNNKDAILTLTDGANSTNGFNVTEGSTLKLAPEKGSSLTLAAANSVSGSGEVLVDEIIETVIESDGSTTEKGLGVGTVNIESDNSAFTGSFVQKMGNVIAKAGSVFFGGTNTVQGGSLTINKNATLDGTNTIEGGVLNLADGAILASSVDVVKNANTGTNGTVNLYNTVTGRGEDGAVLAADIANGTNGVLTYVNSDSSTQSINLTDGVGLGLFNGVVVQGDLTLNSDSGVKDLTLGNGSGVEADLITLNDSTSITYKDNAYIKEDSAISAGADSVINFANNTTDVEYSPIISSVDGTATINKTGAGALTITSSMEDYTGSVNVSGGSLDMVTTEEKNFSALSVSNATLTAASDVTVDGNANISNSGVTISGAFSAADTVVSGADTVVNLASSAVMESLLLNDAVINANGNVDIANALVIGQSTNSTSIPAINMQNGVVGSVNADSLTLNSDFNMNLDYDPQAGNAIDGINVNNLTVNNDSQLLLTGINFTTSPDNYTFAIDGSKIITSADGSVVPLGESEFIANTHIGKYLVRTGSTAAGSAIKGALQSINPQMYRAQVATVAQYANQLAFNNIIFDHAALVSGQYGNADNDKVANQYAAINPLFAPYQYSKKDGGLWFKAYGNFEKISMTQVGRVENNAYGAIVGADLPVVELKDGWKLIPTAYAAYNGGHQNYSFVSMYQNGGQLGAMATAYKGDFFTSLLAYGGGYSNDMTVNSALGNASDTTGNWFAGIASKTAYNIHLPKDFIFQPTALLSYNIFGNQNYGSNFGGLSMSSGFMNGINVAPGMNLIWNKESFSIYGTAQMVFNIMGGVDGYAGRVALDNVRMKHSYFEYGLGFMKKFKDRFAGYFQFTIRNGGRTGVGFQGGLQYRIK